MNRKHNYNLTKKQLDAFEDVVTAIKKAEKTGLTFFGKQDQLTAYRKSGMKHWAPAFASGGDSVPCACCQITDSGADDEQIFDE